MLPKPDITDLTGRALFLDVDGTLLEIAEHPDGVSVDDGLRALLTALHARLDGALALVSGRTVAAIDQIFAPARFPVSGTHGAELRIAGEIRRARTAVLPDEIVQELQRFVSSRPRLTLEPKPSGVSLHYRQAPEHEAECRRLVDRLMPAIDLEFRLIEGKMVLELAPRGHNKGEAIREMLQQQPFMHRQPVFIGDDVTDEDGFRVVRSLGGIAIRVGAAADSRASFMFEDVGEVRRWLAMMHQAGGQTE